MAEELYYEINDGAPVPAASEDEEYFIPFSEGTPESYRLPPDGSREEIYEPPDPSA
jgi:hypothetical protein